MFARKVRSLIPVKPSKFDKGFYGEKRLADKFIKNYEFVKENVENSEPVIKVKEIVYSNRPLDDSHSCLVFNDKEYRFKIYKNELEDTEIYKSTFNEDFINISIVMINTIHKKLKPFFKSKLNKLFDETNMYKLTGISKYTYFNIATDVDLIELLISNREEILTSYKTMTGKQYTYNAYASNAHTEIGVNDYCVVVNLFMSYMKLLDWFSDYLKFEYESNRLLLNTKSIEIPKTHFNSNNCIFYIEDLDSMESDNRNKKLSLLEFLEDNLDKETNTINIDMCDLIIGDNFDMYLTSSNDLNLTSYLNLNDFICIVSKNSVGKKRYEEIIEEIMNITDKSTFKYKNYKIYYKMKSAKTICRCVIKLK